MTRPINETTRRLNLAVGAFVFAFAAILVGADSIAASDASDHIPVRAEGGVAIQGTGPVAYFTQAKPVQGSTEFAEQGRGNVRKISAAE